MSLTAKKGNWVESEQSFLDTAISILETFETMCKEADIGLSAALGLEVSKDEMCVSLVDYFSKSLELFKFGRDSQEMRSQVSS